LLAIGAPKAQEAVKKTGYFPKMEISPKRLLQLRCHDSRAIAATPLTLQSFREGHPFHWFHFMVSKRLLFEFPNELWTAGTPGRNAGVERTPLFDGITDYAEGGFGRARAC
jgi:hypothetical protein